VDNRRLICPHPPSPILPGGCNTSGRSLPHGPPTECLMIIKKLIPRPMLVVPFATRNGSNKHFAKTNRPPACCLQNHPGGASFLGLMPVWNAPTRIGSGRLTNCGSTSATASRWRPANAISMRKLLTKKQEAAHRQCLLDKRAANKRQEAAHKEAARHQCLLKEEASRCLMAECAALT
jgi:hypothetical protein